MQAPMSLPYIVSNSYDFYLEIFCNRSRSDDNHVLESVKQSYRVGEKVTVTCKEGYGFSHPRFVDTVTCTDSGDWDLSFTKCQGLV